MVLAVRKRRWSRPQASPRARKRAAAPPPAAASAQDSAARAIQRCFRRWVLGDHAGAGAVTGMRKLVAVTSECDRIAREGGDIPWYLGTARVRRDLECAGRSLILQSMRAQLGSISRRHENAHTPSEPPPCRALVSRFMWSVLMLGYCPAEFFGLQARGYAHGVFELDAAFLAGTLLSMARMNARRKILCTRLSAEHRERIGVTIAVVSTSLCNYNCEAAGRAALRVGLEP